jgi:hypothetical protein
MNESRTPSVYPLLGEHGHEPETEASAADVVGADPAPGLS